VISLEVSARPIYDENGKIVYAIAVFQDITQRLLSKRQLQEYSQTLEQKVIERTEEISRQKNTIEKEKQKSDLLLLNILPEETAEELKAIGRSIPKRYEKATVMFTDFVNFSMRSEEITPDELINEINFYFSAFDTIISKYNLEKIKTIGDSYMCAGGLPVANNTHPQDMVKAALEIRAFILQVKKEKLASGKRYFDCRIGIHTGALIAGIAGIKKFVYDIWGDTVNIASRMEGSCEPNMINISGSTYELVKDSFQCSYRGKIESKHNRFIEMYYVHDKHISPEAQKAEEHILNRLKNELPVTLSYHGYHHTLDVMNAAMQLADAENLPEEDRKLLRIAVAFHDAGFIYLYKDHEEKGCEMATEILPSYGFSEEQIGIICDMIMATKIPQQPKTLAEKIIADADLDYLGREDVFPIAQTLFDELKIHADISEESRWNQIQITFLKDHHYHTQFAIKQRAPNKQQYLEKLLKPVH
jgi:class 3 adenylate cyclase